LFEKYSRATSNIYIEKIIGKLSGITSFLINGSEYNFITVKEDDIFDILIKTNQIGYYATQYNSYQNRYIRNHFNSEFSFLNIEQEIDSNESYKEREQLIQAKYGNKIEQLKKHIEELKSEKNEIKL
jgi:hypothetical protein